jgi:phytoene desaturase
LKKRVVVIGSGFAGLSAASFMAKAGWQVTVIEKNTGPGGRARQLKENGFTYDMGPSWYWMPDVFERYFCSFGKKLSDYYKLLRLDPSYRIYWNDDFTDIPASYEELKKTFEKLEPGSAAMLDKYLKEAAYKYETGINKLVHKPGRSLTEFLELDVIKGVFKLDVFTSVKKHVQKHFKNAKLRQLMEFPVLFLGALPENTPALYSLMNYADIKGGTWYPEGGMYAVVDGMYRLAIELGVEFSFNEDAQKINVTGKSAKELVTDKNTYKADVIISGADYHFTETSLLAPENQSYSASYWNKRVMAPSCLLYYIGLNKKLSNVQHHSLFFDVSFEQHGKEIYTTEEWPSDPLFYVNATSVTDKNSAPPGCENLFFLIPIAAGLKGDTEEVRNKYFDMIVKRMEKYTGQSITDSIIYKKTYSVSNFISDYNSFRGNAYGLANVLKQTAILKPSCKSKKVNNLFYTGQLTVPGPGVPPSLISGEVVAKEIIKEFN